MPRHTSLAILFLALSAGTTSAAAQSRLDVSRPIMTQAAVGDGRVRGVVLDERGAALGGATILAAGATVLFAESDNQGRFSLQLPVGEYLLRVIRDGYLATYREPVRVEANKDLERMIRLTRRDGLASAGEAAVQPSTEPESLAAAPAADDRTGRGEMAWRLRHLRRTVLREVQPGAIETEEARPPVADRLDVGPLVDQVFGRSARAASAFLTGTDFTGHVNLLMTGALPGVARPTPDGWSTGVADVYVGAPVGSSGAWSIRGAMAAGDRSSWTIAGEYRADDDQPHVVRLGVSFSSQGVLTSRDLAAAFAVPESRSAGGIEVSDRWRVRPAVTVDYGLRIARYDYLEEPHFVSPHAGLRVDVFPGIEVHASSSRQLVAPGATDLAPPMEAGPWLAPSRVFMPLVPGAVVRPARIDRHIAGVDRVFGSSGAVAVGVAWFSESTTGQMATLFGLDRPDDAGHYYVATVGSVAVTGWRVRARGGLGRHVRARVEYATGRALWSDTRGTEALRALEPGVARRGREAVSGLRTAFDISVPATVTHVGVHLIVNRVSPADTSATPGSITGRGVDFEVRQRLPYQPLDAGLLNALFTLSTLLHDSELASLYDDVLTVRAPVRLTAGLQLGF